MGVAARTPSVSWKRLFGVALPLVAGPEALGMRPGTADQMQDQLGPLASVYGVFQERTGLDIAEVAGLLAG